jgi:multiple sugar transport system substrate-binding protein
MAHSVSRRRVVKAAALLAAAAAPLARVSAATKPGAQVNWLMHPVHFEQMGKGELIDKLQKETGIQINVTQMPFPQYREKLLILLRQGASDFDIVGISNSWWDGSINRYLLPLEDFMAKRPLEDASDIVGDYLYKVGSHNYAVPFRIGPMVLHYRKDLYQKYGLSVPKTMEDYYRNAKAITEGEKGQTYGAFMMGEQSFFSLWDWTSYLYSFGGKFLDSGDLEKAKVVVNSPQGIEAMRFVSRMNREGLFPPGTLTNTWSNFISLMQQGKIAQGIEWSVYMQPVADPAKSTVADKIGWAECPSGVAGAGAGRTGTVGWGLFIPKAAKNKEAAWDVMRWVTRPESDHYMALHGGGPFRKSTITSPSYKDTAKVPEVLIGALSRGAPVWDPVGTLPRASEIIDKSVVDLAGALSGSLDPAAACNNIARHIKELALA